MWDQAVWSPGMLTPAPWLLPVDRRRTVRVGRSRYNQVQSARKQKSAAEKKKE